MATRRIYRRAHCATFCRANRCQGLVWRRYSSLGWEAIIIAQLNLQQCWTNRMSFAWNPDSFGGVDIKGAIGTAHHGCRCVQRKLPLRLMTIWQASRQSLLRDIRFALPSCRLAGAYYDVVLICPLTRVYSVAPGQLAFEARIDPIYGALLFSLNRGRRLQRTLRLTCSLCHRRSDKIGAIVKTSYFARCKKWLGKLFF